MSTAQETLSNAKATDANILLKTLIAFKKGNFSVRMPVDQTGIDRQDRRHAQRNP